MMKRYSQNLTLALCLLHRAAAFYNISMPRGSPSPHTFLAFRSGGHAKIQSYPHKAGLATPLLTRWLPNPSSRMHATVDPASIGSSLPRHRPVPNSIVPAGAEKVTFMQRIKKYFAGPDDNLTTKQRLAKMGLSAVLSYGCVCNAVESVTVSLAWYVFAKNTRMSPLAPGQWKGFLAVYAGFWVFNHLAQPARVAMAVAISPAFDRFVTSVQRRLKVSKTVAITSTAIITNVFGTLAAMSSGICLASICAGVPIFMPRA